MPLSKHPAGSSWGQLRLCNAKRAPALPLTCPFPIPGLPVILFYVVNTQITHFDSMLYHHKRKFTCSRIHSRATAYLETIIWVCLACWHWKCICSECSSSACPSVIILMHCLCLKNALLLPCHQPLICCLCGVEHAFFTWWDFNTAVTLTSSQRLHFAMYLFEPCFPVCQQHIYAFFNKSKTFRLFFTEH